jgi:hypothetical protein
MDTSVLIVLGIVFLFAVLIIIAFFVFLNKKPKNFRAGLETKLGKANLEAEMQSDTPEQPEQTAKTETPPLAQPLAEGALSAKHIKAGEDVLIESKTGGSTDVEDVDAKKSVLISTSNPGTDPKAPPPA